MFFVKRFFSQLRSEHDPPITRFVAGLATAACGVAAALAVGGWTLGDPLTVGALAVVAAVAERGRVKLTSTTEESISLLPTLFAGVLFGPLAGLIVGAASLLGEIGQPPYFKWVTYTSSRALVGAAAGFLAIRIESLSGSPIAATALATTVAAIAAEVMDVGFAAVAARLRGTRSPGELVRTLAPLIASSVPLYAPVVSLLVVAYRELSPLTLPLFFVPALAAQRLFALYQEQRRLAAELMTVNAHLESANLSFATALVATLDARDRYTAGHSAAVAVYARDIATRMGLDDATQALAFTAGLVHDIGKIGLAPGLLEKPGGLTLDERRQMEAHAIIGERILGKVHDYAQIASVVRHHHERVDGHGYPDGLRGDEIPLISKIISVADAYNAMTSDRPYRDAMPSRVARLRLAQAVESQFDTSVVAAFEALLAAGPESYRVAEGDQFSAATPNQSEPPELSAVAAR